MATTYEPIATTTLGSAASSVTFSSIPSTYTDLILIADVLGSGTADLDLTLNNDSASNYSKTYLTGNGTTASSSRYNNTAYIRLTQSSYLTSSARNIFNISIFNYANTTTYKTVLYRTNSAGQAAEASVGLWRKTPEAITRIDLTGTGANIASGSTFTLYGIKAA